MGQFFELVLLEVKLSVKDNQDDFEMEDVVEKLRESVRLLRLVNVSEIRARIALVTSYYLKLFSEREKEETQTGNGDHIGEEAKSEEPIWVKLCRELEDLTKGKTDLRNRITKARYRRLTTSSEDKNRRR